VPIVLLLVFGARLSAQSAPATSDHGSGSAPASVPGSIGSTAASSKTPGAPSSSAEAGSPKPSEGQQTKRILGILPNFAAVSANTYLPPLSLKEKFWLSTENTFDYSSFISVGFEAGVEQASNTYPEFHHGGAAFGRYYWHTFADVSVENYVVGAILPAITHEDPRYYTLYRGGFFHRAGYAISRLCITKNDEGYRTFNFSEILGSAGAAEVSSRYYPRQERSGGELVERWMSQLLNDGVGNIVEEFWPDINHKLLHRH
jgi:hypothetical protein